MVKKNPDKRAKELHDLLEYERTKRHTTTAVGNTEHNTVIVGTSENYIRSEIKEALLDNEIPAKSRHGNHAEENVMDEADELDLQIVESLIKSRKESGDDGS